MSRISTPLVSSFSSVFSFAEIFQVSGVYGPEMSFAVGTAADLKEALVEAEIVTNAVPPARAFISKVRIMGEHKVVNIA